MELRVLSAVRYLTPRKYADASEVTVTETDHTQQGHEIWSLLSYPPGPPLRCHSYLFLSSRIDFVPLIVPVRSQSTATVRCKRS